MIFGKQQLMTKAKDCYLKIINFANYGKKVVEKFILRHM
jgi:hypothetical protein